jgi:hypothetical protein
MKVVGIVGSPKSKGSMSAALLEAVFSHLEGAETECVLTSGLDAGGTPEVAADVTARMLDADAVVLTFPIYVDGLPSHLLRLLEAVGTGLREKNPDGDGKPATVYVVANCGFFEPEHTGPAIEQVRLWCEMTGLKFGRAFALGGGGIGARIPVGRGPLRRAGKAARSLANSILALESGETLSVRIGIPRFLYILGGHRGWNAAAKRRGLTKDDLLKH